MFSHLSLGLALSLASASKPREALFADAAILTSSASPSADDFFALSLPTALSSKIIASSRNSLLLTSPDSSRAFLSTGSVLSNSNSLASLVCTSAEVSNCR